MTEQAEQATEHFEHGDEWEGERKSSDAIQVEDALATLYPEEGEPKSDEAAEEPAAEADATAATESEPPQAEQQASETDDDEDSDPYEQAYREFAEDHEIARLAQAETQTFYKDLLTVAHGVGIDPNRAAQAVKAGKVNDVLEAVETAAKRKVGTIEDKGQKAAAQTQADQLMQSLRQSAQVLGQVGQHFQTKQQAREEQKLQRKIDREKQKLPEGFDHRANREYMRRKGFSDEQIKGVTSARDAMIIDAARRQEEADNAKPSKSKPVRIPRKKTRQSKGKPERELSRIEQKHQDIDALYNSKPKQKQRRKSTGDDAVSILYGS